MNYLWCPCFYKSFQQQTKPSSIQLVWRTLGIVLCQDEGMLSWCNGFVTWSVDGYGNISKTHRNSFSKECAGSAEQLPFFQKKNTCARFQRFRSHSLTMINIDYQTNWLTMMQLWLQPGLFQKLTGHDVRMLSPSLWQVCEDDRVSQDRCGERCHLTLRVMGMTPWW